MKFIRRKKNKFEIYLARTRVLKHKIRNILVHQIITIEFSMLQNLFADSEKRILKALDRGLEDFVAGKVKFTSARPDPQTEEAQSAQEAMLAEIMEENDGMNESKASRSLPNDVMDADIVVKTDQKEEQARAKKNDASLSARREAALKSMNQNTAADGVKVEEEIQGKGLEFAVQAAKRAAAKRQTNKEDFAVAAAAKKVAASSKRSKTTELEAVDTTTSSEDIDPMSIDLSSIRPPMLDEDPSVPRAFRQTISSPKARSGKKSTKGSKTEEVTSKASVSTETSERDAKIDSVINSVDERKQGKGADASVSETGPFNTVYQGTIDDEINKATQEALDELDGEDMTPEELLANVMKYGDEQKKRKVKVAVSLVEPLRKPKKFLLNRK